LPAARFFAVINGQWEKFLAGLGLMAATGRDRQNVFPDRDGDAPSVRCWANFPVSI